MKRYLKKSITLIKYALVFLFIIFEELAWNKLGKPAYEEVKSLKVMDRFKDWVSKIEHRLALLALFLTPFILMEVSAILATKAFVMGALYWGLALYSLKIIMTVPVVIIFTTGKDVLVSFFVIRYSYGAILKFKRSDAFRGAKRQLKTMKSNLKEKKIALMGKEKGTLRKSFRRLYQKIKKTYRG